ncbi:MAG TPA: tetratricopeptide repeat protein [Allosphingosinicella sp.]
MNGFTLRITASALVIGLSTVGCQQSDEAQRPSALSSEAPQKRDAAGLYDQAQREYKKGDLALALSLMEKAVEYSPRDAGYRMGLAELYLRSGRFVAAERTFADVVSLYPENERASLYLGLVQAAQGKTMDALSGLEQLEGRAKPDDIGLAYALAGNTDRAIALLEEAARSPQANARVRQNLALAYALSGNWAKAKAIASQDLSPMEAERRLAQWAALSSAANQNARVAAFFGVTPVEDSGQPVRLALSQPAETTAYAETAPASPVVTAEAAPEPMEQASYITPAEVPAYTPPAPIVEPVMPVRQAVATATRKAPAQTGRYVVQIGAFGSRGQAEAAWKVAQRRYGFAASRQIITTVIVPEGKGVFHRLAVQGFGTAAEAMRTCRTVKGKGGDCFVRPLAGGALPARIAARR